MHMFRIIIFLAFVFCISCNDSHKEDPIQENWIDLFNGQNLDGWTAKFAGEHIGINYKDRFQVSDSLLKIVYATDDTFKGKFGHLFYKDKFSHYKLKAKYRFHGEQQANGPGWAFRNNGLMLHCQDPKSMTIEQEFPLSLEAQLLGGNGTDERPTANLCTPHTHVSFGPKLEKTHCINSTSKTYHGDGWQRAEVLVLGDSLIQHIMEDEVVLEYQKPIIDISELGETSFVDGAKVKEGYISIQAETAPIEFASIQLLNLCGCMDKKAKNYKSYYQKSDKTQCVY